MSELEPQFGCVFGDKILDNIINVKREYETPCCYNDQCCEGEECDCCNVDGNNTFGYCDCMLSDDDYTNYVENQEKIKKLDIQYRQHVDDCKECQTI